MLFCNYCKADLKIGHTGMVCPWDEKTEGLRLWAFQEWYRGMILSKSMGFLPDEILDKGSVYFVKGFEVGQNTTK